jgi:hypothetical protein
MLGHLILFVLKLRPEEPLIIHTCLRALHSGTETAGMMLKLLVVDCGGSSSDLGVETLSDSAIYLVELLSGQAKARS